VEIIKQAEENRLVEDTVSPAQMLQGCVAGSTWGFNCWAWKLQADASGVLNYQAGSSDAGPLGRKNLDGGFHRAND
jgi:hypothetical protein